MRQFNVVLTYGTYADTPEEALALALTVVDSRAGFYVEVVDDDTDRSTLEGEYPELLNVRPPAD